MAGEKKKPGMWDQAKSRLALELKMLRDSQSAYANADAAEANKKKKIKISDR